MASANITGVCLSIGTSLLMPIVAMAGSGAMSVSLLIAPGYLLYAYAREAIAGKINIHTGIGEWIIGGFILNTLTFIAICHAAAWALARARRAKSIDAADF